MRLFFFVLCFFAVAYASGKRTFEKKEALKKALEEIKEQLFQGSGETDGDVSSIIDDIFNQMEQGKTFALSSPPSSPTSSSASSQNASLTQEVLAPLQDDPFFSLPSHIVDVSTNVDSSKMFSLVQMRVLEKEEEGEEEKDPYPSVGVYTYYPCAQYNKTISITKSIVGVGSEGNEKREREKKRGKK